MSHFLLNVSLEEYRQEVGKLSAEEILDIYFNKQDCELYDDVCYVLAKFRSNPYHQSHDQSDDQSDDQLDFLPDHPVVKDICILLKGFMMCIVYPILCFSGKDDLYISNTPTLDKDQVILSFCQQHGLVVDQNDIAHIMYE
jgi:hypothetical protein